jgi:predicted RNase H-like HicB family nuclease
LKFQIELDREEDGRWIAEIVSLPGVMAYGKTKPEGVTKVKALALRVLADEVEKAQNYSTRPLDVSTACWEPQGRYENPRGLERPAPPTPKRHAVLGGAA